MFMWHGSISEKSLKFFKSKCCRVGCIGSGDGVEYEVYIPFFTKMGSKYLHYGSLYKAFGYLLSIWGIFQFSHAPEEFFQQI